MKNMQVRMRRISDGAASPENFQLVEAEAPSPGRGQMLVRTLWMALDAHALEPHGPGPKRRVPQEGDVVPAPAVCEVVDSRNEIFNAGELVQLDSGLQQYCVSQVQGVHRVKTGGAPASAALGPLGTSGLLAYCGLIDIARVDSTETVLAAAAACISGAMAGQIARIRGCRTIGVARTAQEAAWCLREAHFTSCIDLQSMSLDQGLREFAPRGVDVCYDGEGGGIALAVSRGFLAEGGRTIVANARDGICASDPHTRAHLHLVGHGEFEHRREAFLDDAIAWCAEGRLRYHEETVDGLPNAAARLCRVIRGETFGLTVVKN